MRSITVQLVATQRIVTGGLRIGRFQAAEIPWAAVVIQNHVAIQLFQIHAGVSHVSTEQLAHLLQALDQPVDVLGVVVAAE